MGRPPKSEAGLAVWVDRMGSSFFQSDGWPYRTWQTQLCWMLCRVRAHGALTRANHFNKCNTCTFSKKYEIVRQTTWNSPCRLQTNEENDAKTLRFCIFFESMILWLCAFCVFVVLSHCDVMWFRGVVVLWFCESVNLGFCDRVICYSSDRMVWFCDFMISWSMVMSFCRSDVLWFFHFVIRLMCDSANLWICAPFNLLRCGCVIMSFWSFLWFCDPVDLLIFDFVIVWFCVLGIM